MKPSIKWNPKEQRYYLYNAASDAPMNSKENTILVSVEHSDQKKLMKALQRKLERSL